MTKKQKRGTPPPRAFAKARARSELFENYCSLPPAHRRLVLGVIEAFAKIPSK